jgi:ubiquinone/menaquinone biosynthesis C-methylase UbiE
MVHDRAVPGASTVIQGVSQRRSLENYRFAASAVKEKRVLDIGPGYGLGYDLLLANEPEKIVCVDRFDEAKENFAVKDPRIEHVTGDFMDNSFEDESFDVVMCLATMYYLKDHDQLLKEILRVLVPGGTLFINTFDAELLETIFGCVLEDTAPHFGVIYSGDKFQEKVAEAFGNEPRIQVQSPITWYPRWRRVISLCNLPAKLLFARPRVVPGDGARRKGVYTMLVAQKNSE